MARIDISDLRERCRALPQKLVLELLGFRQWVELQRFADKWRLPIGGKTTDLFIVFRELRLFASKYGPVLTALIEDLPADGSDSELGVRYLKAKIAKTEADAQLAQLRAEHKSGNLMDRESTQASLRLLADRINRTSEVAVKRWGDDAFELFSELVAGFERDLKIVFGDASDSNPDDPQAGAAALIAKSPNVS